MTKFHLAFLIGFFLGALAMFVLLRVVYLYAEEHQQKGVLVRRLREIRDASGRLPCASHASTDHFLPDREQLGEEGHSKVHYLFIFIKYT